jgi:HEAT repeat protein
VRALGATGDFAAVRLLIASARDREWFVRLRALAAIAQLRCAAALETVILATSDENFAVRRQAAVTLASLGTHPDQVLRELMRGGDRFARDSYLSNLARSGVLWRTVPLLCSRNETLQRAAEHFLADAIRAGYTEEITYAAATDPDDAVRAAARTLLSRFRGTTAPPDGPNETAESSGEPALHSV